MKLVLDSCISSALATKLSNLGYDVNWFGSQVDPSDENIMQTAYLTNAILITHDKDFGELAVNRKLPHHGILRLLSDYTSDEHLDVCLAVFDAYTTELLAGSIITAWPGRIRIRPSESP